MSDAARLDPSVGRAFYGAFKEGLRQAQQEAVAPVSSGDDVVVLAGTGSGKTEAVMAPLVSRWRDPLVDSATPVILYVAPTRALVNDIYRRLEPPLERLGITLGVRHGERNDLLRVHKPAILVTTPESLDVMLCKVGAVLSGVRAVIVDEAHLLYNTQRGMQLAILLRRLERQTRHPLQVVAMSATVADPSALWAFFRPLHVPTVVHSRGRRPIVRQIRLGWGPAELADALSTLRDSNPGGLKVLAFTDSRADCDRLATALREGSGYGEAVFAHHSSLSKAERQRTEAEFQRLRAAVCVATSTLELGIDIGDIELIVLYGRARGWESFLQRVGRGNRRSDTVTVMCVVPEGFADEVPSALGYQALLHQVEQERLEASQPLALFGAACQQLISIALTDGGGFRRLGDVVDLMSPWPHLHGTTIRRLVDHLFSSDHLVEHPVQARFGPGHESHRLEDRREVWSNFPLGGRDIDVYHGHHHLGRIPGQNLLHLKEHSVFAFAGRRYEVRKLWGDRVDVLPTQRSATITLRFGGTAAELDPTLVEAEMLLLQEGSIWADVRSRARFEPLSKVLAPLAQLAPDRLAYWREQERYVYLTFAGQQLNSLLAEWFDAGCDGVSELTLEGPHALDFTGIPQHMSAYEQHFGAVKGHDKRRTLYQELLPAELLRAEMRDAWLRTPVFERTLRRLAAAIPLEVPAPHGVRWRKEAGHLG
jgi:ATP-dependent helicase Lhr and Lhr-like helicase